MDIVRERNGGYATPLQVKRLVHSVNRLCTSCIEELRALLLVHLAGDRGWRDELTIECLKVGFLF